VRSHGSRQSATCSRRPVLQLPPVSRHLRLHLHRQSCHVRRQTPFVYPYPSHTCFFSDQPSRREANAEEPAPAPAAPTVEAEGAPPATAAAVPAPPPAAVPAPPPAAVPAPPPAAVPAPPPPEEEGLDPEELKTALACFEAENIDIWKTKASEKAAEEADQWVSQ
jgi:hypothetical protein